jgi:phosphohistidine swiveling domain-containing protein
VKQAGLVADYIEQYFYIDGNYRYTAVLTPEVVLQKAREALKHQGNVAANGSAHAESLSQEELACIEILKRSEVIQDVRKKLNLMGSFGLSRFLDEAVARTGVEQGLALRAFWNEYENILLDRSFAAVLGRRTSATAVYENGETAYLEAVAITPADQATSSVSVIKGTPASKGCVTGRVVVVRTTDEFHKVEVGGVLVAEMTRPDFVAVMKKASAIVTDEGGLTCHAAIVARELGKPCIVGTKVATQVLKDGDTVEVNAATGMITVLKRVG